VKKIVMLALSGTLIGAAAFGLPKFGLSAGAGGFFAADIGGGMKTSGGEQTTAAAGGGGYVFMDAVFAELGFGISGGGTTQKSTGIPDTQGSYTALDLSVLGKYPVDLGFITLFPLAGIDYQIVVSAKDQDGGDQKDELGDLLAPQLKTLWFQIGVGFDFSLAGGFYLRGELLYALRARNKSEERRIDQAKLEGFEPQYQAGRGPVLKIAAGYKFF
jgi:hypothetical protein